jgi:DNA-binding NtrC family response regulator
VGLVQLVGENDQDFCCGGVTVQRKIPFHFKGAYDYLVKPISEEDLVFSLRRTLEKKRLLEILDIEKGRDLPVFSHPEAFQAILTRSPALLRLLKEAELHADSDAPMRVLQDGEYTPVGSSFSQKVDVRIVAATNEDLEELISGKRFRKDLYYRIRGGWLHLPPLRERAEDIPLLVDFYLNESCARPPLWKLIPTPAFPWPTWKKILSSRPIGN